MSHLRQPYIPATSHARTFLYMCGQEELVYFVGRDDAVCGCGVCAEKGGGAFGIGLMNRLERSTIQKSYKKFGMESKNLIRNLENRDNNSSNCL